MCSSYFPPKYALFTLLYSLRSISERSKDETGDAQLKLLWESPSQTLAAIPPQFFSAEKPETPVGVAGNGTGLKGTYYNNSDFTNLVLERKDGEIDFDWGVGSPDAVMEPDSFSVRWTGEIEPRYTNEDYRFYLQNDDGARLWLDGELIVDNWDNPAPERASQPLSLEAGRKYDIQLEYREEVGTAGVQLLWSSREQEKETIPASQLFGEDPADCTPIAVGWSQTLDIAQPGAYTFDIDLPFGTTFTVNGETFDTTPEDNSFSLLLPAGAIDFQLQMPAISPCAPPWSDTPENEGGPEIELGITFPTGERRRGYIEGGWLTNAGPGGGTGGDDGGWWDIDWPSWEPVDPGTNEPPPASGEEPPGTGLYAQYFKGTTFSNLAYAKFVPNVYEDWDYKGPLWDDSHLEDEVRLNVEADNFGVRYTGQIKAIEDGEYKFSFKELDGKARLWVNGQLVMDGEGHGTPPDANGNGIADDFYYGDVSQSISLEAGQKYNFQLDFVDPGGEASAVLHWEKDGGAPATIWNSLLYPTMPPGMLLVNDEPTPVLVGKSSAAASLLSQYFYDDYESVNVTVRDRSPQESQAFLDSPSGDVLWSGTLSKSEVLGTDSYLEIAQKSYAQMFGSELPERDRLYGTHLAVEYELLDENGAMVTIDNRAPGRFSDNFYVYRWIDAIGEGKAFGLKDAAAVFHEKTDEGLGEFKPQKEVDLFVPASVQTNFTWTGSPDFTAETVSNDKVLFEYNPDLSDVEANKVVQKPITLEVNKGVKIGQIAASFQPHLRFDDYWLPSTDTLDLPPEQRNELFDRILSNENVSKFYLDVLASKGPTVNYPYFLPDNILSGQRDSMDDFYGELNRRGKRGQVEVVPWFEGTGRIANMTGFYNWYNNIGAKFNTHGNLHYIDIFNGKIDKNNDNEKTGWDIFLHAVDSFITKYKLYYDFSSVIVDDHFGIAAKTSGNVEIMKQRLKDRDENFKNESNDILLKRGLADLVSKRVKDLSDFLWTNHAVALSISVNPFDLKKAKETDPNLPEINPQTKKRDPNAWHNALQTNYHDVAKWIEEGYIRGDRGGEINVQIYREDPETVKALYDDLRNDLETHLKGKLADYDNDADFADYLNKFPKIAVSLAAEGNTGTDGKPWKGNRENIENILNHISKKKFVRIDDDRELTIRVSAFDGDDFHNLPV